MSGDKIVNEPLLGRESAQPHPSTGYAFYVLFVLFCVYLMNQIDRLVFPFIIADIREDFTVTDGQYGLLVGFGFGIFFVIVGLFVGPLADNFSRRNILVAGLVFWSAMTFFSGLAKSYIHLLLARLGLGIGTAACNPPAFSILSDYFPPEKRTLANSIYTMGIYIGGGASSILAGQIAAQRGTAHAFSWRSLLKIFGYIGFAIGALAILTVREPRRGTFAKPSADKKDKEARKFTVRETIRYIMATETCWKYFIAAGIRTMGGNAFGGFVPGYLRTSFPDNIPKLLTSYGLITCIFGATASFGGGAIARRWQAKNTRAGALIGAIGAIASLPFVFGIMFATKIAGVGDSGLALALSCLALEYLTAEVWGGPASAIVSSVLPAGMQGTGFSVYFSISAIIGGAGPQILGLLLQAYASAAGISDVKTYITAFFIVATYVLGALGFILATRNLKKDAALKEEVEVTGVVPELPPLRVLAFKLGAGLLTALTITLVVLSLVLTPPTATASVLSFTSKLPPTNPGGGFATLPFNATLGEPFSPAPALHLLTKAGAVVATGSDSSLVVTATLDTVSAQSWLLEDATATAKAGVATFDGLRIVRANATAAVSSAWSDIFIQFHASHSSQKKHGDISVAVMSVTLSD
jgi:MFS family permease